MTRFDGDPRSGAKPRRGCPQGRRWDESSARVGRSFTKEFKAEVVARVGQPGNSAASVARDLDLTETTVRAWVKQADVHNGRGDGLTSEQLSWQSCAGRTGCCARSATSSSERRLSSPGRPGERVPVHRGGEATAAQRRQGVRAARGLPVRLLHLAPALRVAEDGDLVGAGGSRSARRVAAIASSVLARHEGRGVRASWWLAAASPRETVPWPSRSYPWGTA